MEQADWGMNTNLEAAFTEILRVATKYKVPQEEMPKTLIVFSDMQFDSATRTGYSSKKVTAQDSVRQQYEAAGYNVPSVIYWNLNGQTGNVPVTYNEEGTALVSGFSTSLLKTILSAEKMTPESIMLDAVMQDKYAVI